MIYFYIVHFVLLLYGCLQLLFLVDEVMGGSSGYTVTGLFVIPGVIVSALRMSIGRIALAFMAMLGMLIALGQIVMTFFSDSGPVWIWLFDLALFGSVWHMFNPTGKWNHLYSKWGMFSKAKNPTTVAGLEYMERIRQGEFQPPQVYVNFFAYCKEYMIERGELNEQQADLLLLDPELGKEIDTAKQKWLLEDLGMGVDVDEFLVTKRFDAPQMKRINLVLDKFAFEYPERENKIIEYLQSIGYE